MALRPIAIRCTLNIVRVGVDHRARTNSSEVLRTELDPLRDLGQLRRLPQPIQLRLVDLAEEGRDLRRER